MSRKGSRGRFSRGARAFLTGLHDLNRLEAVSHESGPSETLFEAHQVVYSKKPVILAELAILDDSTAADLVRFSLDDKEARNAVARVIKDGGNKPTGSLIPDNDGTQALGLATSRWEGFLDTADANGFASAKSNAASTGLVRLANNSDKVCWPNAANTSDIRIFVDSANILQIPAVLDVAGDVTVDSTLNVGGTATLGTGGTLTGTFVGSPTLSGNLDFTGSPTFAGAVTLGAGGSLIGTFSGNPTSSGNSTFSGSPVFSGSFSGSAI